MNRKLVFTFRILIALAFIAFSFVVLYYRDQTQLSEIQSFGFAILLFAYGVFRIYRAIKQTDDIFVLNKTP